MKIKESIDEIIEDIGCFAKNEEVSKINYVIHKVSIGLCLIGCAHTIGKIRHDFEFYRPIFDHTGDACVAGFILFSKDLMNDAKIFKNYSLEIATMLWTSYVVLSEIFPIMPGNTRDLHDIPLGIVGGLSTYLLYRGKKGNNDYS